MEIAELEKEVATLRTRLEELELAERAAREAREKAWQKTSLTYMKEKNTELRWHIAAMKVMSVAQRTRKEQLAKLEWKPKAKAKELEQARQAARAWEVRQAMLAESEKKAKRMSEG